jgi:hypothetical protein
MSADPEFRAMASVYEALAPLDDESRARVLRWVTDRFGYSPPRRPNPNALGTTDDAVHANGELADEADLAETFARAQPTTEMDKVLVAAYWFQERGAKDQESQSLNKELKNLGHGIDNIARAVSNLTETRPALVIQTRKTGSTRQARKRFRVTQEGINRVRRMLGGDSTPE